MSWPASSRTRRIEILCLVFYTDVPHPRQRAQEFIAYASIANPWDTSADVIRVLEKAAREAAFAATVFAVIFSDITTALILFKGIFAEKVFDAFGAALRCVDAEIWLELKPKGDGTWHDI